MRRNFWWAILPLFASPVRAVCTVDEVASNSQMYGITRAAELAKQGLPLLKRFGDIGNRAKDPNKPLDQQLSQADLAEFNTLRTRYEAIELLQLLESNHGRDIRIIKNIFDVAQDGYLGKPEPHDGQEKFPYFAFLQVTRAASEKEMEPDHIAAATGPCSMAVAVQAIENEAFERFHKLPLTQAANQISSLSARYGGGKIDRDKLSFEDRAAYDLIMRSVYAPASREKGFIDDLETVKLLSISADLKYEMSKKDAVDSGGDIHAVGNSIDAMNLSPRSKLGLLMLQKIDEKYPSDYIKERQQIAPMIDSIKKQDAARISKKK